MRSGVPLVSEYKEMLASEMFASMEQFSNSFIERQREVFGDYATRWVSDPLHQWSRQWEYPFVYHSLQPVVSSGDAVRILDAGCGLTFFPFLLADKAPKGGIDCCDADETLAEPYDRITKSSGANVTFSKQDILSLGFDDGVFDAVYCISVMEHLDDYGKAINELARILRPGGVLVVTFDVALDGLPPSGPVDEERILSAMGTHLGANADAPDIDIRGTIGGDNAVTTGWIAKEYGWELLPWRNRKRGGLLGKLGFKRRPRIKPLTVCCVSMKKQKT